MALVTTIRSYDDEETESERYLIEIDGDAQTSDLRFDTREEARAAADLIHSGLCTHCERPAGWAGRGEHRCAPNADYPEPDTTGRSAF